jgi:ABC-type nitrate/sulfonate/bicarbonate transport system substrate-binding protein
MAYVLGGLAAAAFLLVGCGGGGAHGAAGEPVATTTNAPAEKPAPFPCPSPSDQLQVTLDSHAGAENAGILMAEQRGYFRKAGLDVWVRTPGNPEYPVSYVAVGDDDIGITQQPQIVLGNELEETVVAIGSVISKPTAAMIWLKGSGVDEIADLKGKRIAISGALYQSDLLEQALAQAGLTPDDVEVVAAGYELVPKLLNGEVDAIFGGSSNMEGSALEARGAKPVITPVQELGAPAYDELMLIARPACVAKHPALYRRFLAAVARGTAAAKKDPHGTVQAIERNLGSDPEAGRKQTEAQVAATLPLLSRSGRIDLAQAADLVKWMREKDMIEDQPPVEQLFTNDYLAP